MSRPWMPLYVGDYLGDTRRLTTLQHGAYMLLIMEYWQNGGLPNDDEELAQIAGLSPDQWQAMRPKIAALFQEGWKHKRIEAELVRAEEKSNKAKESAGKRWQSKGNANAMPSHSERTSERNAKVDANAMLLQPQPQLEANASNKTREKSRALELMAERDAEFEREFWPAYPNKVGKPDARKAFHRARLKTPLASIMAGLTAYTVGKPPDRAWLNPATFLNQERFADEPAQPMARAGPRGGGDAMARIALGDFGDGGNGNSAYSTPANGTGTGSGFAGAYRHDALLPEQDRVAPQRPLLDL